MSARADSRILDEVFAGGGELGRLMRKLDWAATPLGPVSDWPQSLRTVVSICLNSRFPIVIFWGPHYVKLYNDAYRPILGQSKHPRGLGLPARDVWPEIWNIIGPMLDSVYRDGRATWSADQLLLMDRNGYLEEAYFTFSYSPIRDESGGIGGIFTAVTETTERVLSERRLRTLQELSIEAKTVDSAAAEALAILAKNRRDVPFALVYRLDEDAPSGRLVARLAGATGLPADCPACPEAVALDDAAAAGGWPLAQVAATGEPVIVADLAALFGPLSGGAWPDPPTSAIVLPIAHPRQERPAGLLVLGISPRRAFDADYRSFFSSLADHFATAFVNARAYEEERARAEALAALDRAKTEFFSNISHEFRTPLTLQLGPAQDLLDGRLGELDAGQAAAVEIIYRNTLRSLKLVNALLDFTRVEAGRLQAAFEPVDLGRLTAEIAAQFRSAIERAGLRFRVECAPAPAVPAYVDRTLWEQIVLNLLSNAFKFTLEGEIAVVLRYTGAHAQLTVSDTGAGMTPEDMAHAFERFYRARGQRARTYEGAGIGLALVRQLVELQGGTIDVASRPAAGSAFTITLPLGRSHLPAGALRGEAPAGAPAVAETPDVAAPEAAAPEAGALPGEALQGEAAAAGALPGEAPVGGALAARSFVEEALHWAGDAAERDRLPAPALELEHGLVSNLVATAPRIVVADDNADMAAYLARILGERYRVETVADGAQALEAARREPPDLVLADVMMPHLDGFSLLARLRSDPALAAVPVILVSARAGEESRAEGLEAGADDYLVKPFSARELLARVAKRLDAVAAEQRRERAALAETHAALAESHAQLELLHEIDQRILAAATVADPVGDIARIAARHLRTAMQAYRVSVIRFDLADDMGCVLAADADHAFAPAPADLPALSAFPLLEANLRGEVGYVDDLARVPGVHPLQDALLAAGVHALTSIPLAVDGQTVGCLLIASKRPGRLPAAQVSFASQVAVSLALAMQSALNVAQLVQREAALAETAELLQMSRQEFQALSRRLVDALEEERETLARNLHDEAGQALTVLGMGLARLSRSGHLAPEAAARVNELKQLSTNIAIELRRIATHLRPASLDELGLLAALRQYADAYTQQTGVEVDITVDEALTGEGAGRHPEAETVLYRIAQEALTNVAQHAGAAHVVIELGGDASALTLTVRDDGRGFDMAEALRRGRLGLLGMRERAEMLGGALTVESAPGAGAAVRARVPAR